MDSFGAPDVEILLEPPRDAAHGDLATNVALQLSKRLNQKPRDLAQALVDRLDLPSDVVSKIEIAGPGFINFWVSDTALNRVLHRILDEGYRYGRSDIGAGVRVNVEFVSANPTGPLHVGHGRGAALGDAIASLLEAVGYEVCREFYVNDAGTQIDLLAQSLWARVQQVVGREVEVPEGGYHGAYLSELAHQIVEDEGESFADLDVDDGVSRCSAIAIASQRVEQERDLTDFGVEFDVVFHESELYRSRRIDETLERLAERGLTYERDGALWLRTEQYGDEKDRVLRKQDGTFTYFLPDIAYHLDKGARGFHRSIDIWGADHHGYVPRMDAVLRALGLDEEFFRVVIVQLVRVTKGGTEVRFSKRSGDFVTLRDLFEETGVDAARYFFLMRRAESQFVFDIDLATKQSDENPVYYVQYAHTRLAGIFRTAGVDAAAMSVGDADLTRLESPDEQVIIKHLAQYPTILSKAAEAREPHRIIGYLDELAKFVNSWYHGHRVVGVDPATEHARLVLTRAIQIVLANGLHLLGITAPERM